MSLQKNDVLIVGFHFPHMGKSAGYDRLSSYLPFKYINSNNLIFGKSRFGTLIRKINLLLLEFKIILNQYRYKTIHYLYPENHLLFSIKKNRKNIATLHQPIEWFDSLNKSNSLINHLRERSYKKLDGIIVLTSEMAEKVSLLYPSSVVKFIPHGVEIFKKYYKPISSLQNLNMVIIGTNFRNLEIVLKLVEYSNKNKKKWVFNFIGMDASWKEKLRKYNRTIIHPKLKEDEYLKLFSSMHLNILPLEKATANNAMLESHSLGVPTIVTDLASTKDYGVSTTKYFKDFDKLITHISVFETISVENFNVLKEKTINDSSKFYWDNISKKIIEFYEEIKYIKK